MYLNIVKDRSLQINLCINSKYINEDNLNDKFDKLKIKHKNYDK